MLRFSPLPDPPRPKLFPPPSDVLHDVASDVLLNSRVASCVCVVTRYIVFRYHIPHPHRIQKQKQKQKQNQRSACLTDQDVLFNYSADASSGGVTVSTGTVTPSFDVSVLCFSAALS